MAEQSTPIDEGQKKRYVQLRDSFHKKRDELKAAIRTHQSALGALEKELRDSKPHIGGCDSLVPCGRCDIYSMKYLGRSPDQDHTMWYKCVICSHEDSRT